MGNLDAMTDKTDQKLKLMALDADDLAVVSAHLQDAVTRIADLAYQPREHRFVALINRFDWAAAHGGGRGPFERRRAALRIERVTKAQIQGLDLGAKRDVLALLALTFEPRGGEDPGGVVTLMFAGGAAIRLDIECIEILVEDLGGAWAARAKPDHAS